MSRKITPSGVGAYFHNHCPLFLHLSTRAGDAGRAPEKAAVIPAQQRAIFEKGVHWEVRLTEHLAAEGHLLDGSHMDVAELLTTTDPDAHGGFLFIYHMRFTAPEDFAKRLFPDGSVRFSTMEPDFLRLSRNAEGKKVITIIDAKSSKALEISHQVQVSMYALVLESIIRTLSVEDVIVDSVGVVWRPQAPNLLDHPEQRIEDTFSLEVTKPLVEDFLLHRLQGILQVPEEDVDWHYSSVCEGCSFQARCEKRVVEEQTLSFIPNISRSEHRFIKSLLPKDRKSKAGTLKDIEDLVAREPVYADVANLPPSHRQRLSRILRLKSDVGPDTSSLSASPVLRAARTLEPAVIGKYSLLLPPTEDNGVYISVHLDPLNGEIFAWAIAVTHDGADSPTEVVVKTLDRGLRPNPLQLGEDMIHHLAGILRSLEGSRLQCYTVDEKGRYDLISVLVRHLCVSTASSSLAAIEEAEICLLALVDDANALTTQVQPLLLNTAESLTGISALSKGDLEDRIAQLQVTSPTKAAAASPSRSSKTSKADVKAKLEEILAEILHSKLVPSPPLLGSILRIVNDLVVLPVASFYTLEDCAKHLAELPSAASVSSESIYAEWLDNEGRNLQRMLGGRMETATRIISGLRRLLDRHCRAEKQFLNTLLIAESPIFRVPQPLAFRDSNLRKLAFMTQYEVVSRCEELRDTRLRLREDSGMVLKYLHFDMAEKVHVLEVINGGDLVTADSDRKQISPDFLFTMNKWLFTELNGAAVAGSASLRVEPYLMYPDTALFDCTTIPKIDLPFKLGFASICSVQREDKARVLLNITADKTFKCSVGNFYLLQPRMVDTNMKKILAVLRTLDSVDSTLFQKLLTNPIGWGEQSPFTDEAQRKDFVAESERLRTMYRQLSELTSSVVPMNMMKSQAKVFTGIRDQRLELVWGPPGTGKTHFLALTILNLAASSWKNGVPFRICVSAFTHNAIDNLLDRVKSLLAVARSIKDEDRPEWRDVLHVVKLGQDIEKEPWKQPLVVVGATCWALYRELLNGKATAPVFDMVIVDEGSQVPVALGSIVASALKPDTGRLVVCGDHLQLAPILQMRYPDPSPTEPLLYRSFLQCLMRQSDGRHVKDTIAQAQSMSALPCMGMLRENHRMNAQLTNFSRRLYGSNFELIKDRGRLFFHADKAVTPATGHFLTSIMDNRASMATLVLAPGGVPDVAEAVLAMSYERQVRMEASVVACLAKSIVASTDWQEEEPAKRLFIVTPHRVQQAAVLSALADDPACASVKVDTVEKMQGLEAEVVIICYGFLDLERLKGEGDFLYDFHRINVAVTRARKLCIFVTSEAILRPGLEIVCNPARQEGFAHLAAFRDSSQLEVRWPLDLS